MGENTHAERLRRWLLFPMHGFARGSTVVKLRLFSGGRDEHSQPGDDADARGKRSAGR
jgi:hypothetical protein